MRKTIYCCLISAALLALPAIASAHAFLDHSEPKVGSTVTGVSDNVKVWFTEALEPTFSKLEIFDADGKQVDKLDSHPDDKDSKLLIVGVGQLPPGKYKVKWSVVAEDTHHTQGDFSFTVQP